MALAIAGVLWVAAVIAGSRVLLTYANTAGSEGSPVDHWPESTQIPRRQDRPVVVMFAHPQCPCTRASIGELSLLVAQSQGASDVWVVFLRPKGETEDWTQTDLWRSAAAIPGVQVRQDQQGAEAARFHAETSGYTVLYGKDGRLLFRGGITAARGHSGDNAGRAALVALLHDRTPEIDQTKVFGCSLLNPK